MEEVILPKACNGEAYADWTLNNWMLKVCEECGEAVMALKLAHKAAHEYAAYVKTLSLDTANETKLAREQNCLDEFLEARRNLCLELTDVITAATSMLDAAGVDAADRQMYQRIINDRNGRRDGGRRFRREE